MSTLAIFAHAALFTVFLWWFTTGAILYLDGMPRRTFKLSMALATAALGAALHVLWATQNDTTVTGAYIAFGCAIVAWGWNEMAFLMGAITGPRTTPCPPDAKGVERFRYATEAILWHEIAIAATALAIFMLTADATNRVGFQTFAILWVLRLSAKINVFLGVRNLSEEFLPAHLRYLETYFRRRSTLNPVFPLSITFATVLTAYLAARTMAPGATAFDVTASALLATLAALALLEHWLMVVPFSAAALWRWGLSSHAPQQPTAAPVGALATGPITEPIMVPFPKQTVKNLPRRRP